MNEEQRVYWDGVAGERWTANQEILDRATSVFGLRAIDAAAVRGGERAIDVGCGCGQTSLVLADRVGPSGRVLGLDLSNQMLARARERAGARQNVEFRQADAAAVSLPAEYDLIFSRFGVMFFDDPSVAFANLRRALRPGGRLSFVVWRAYEDNPWVKLPVDAIRKLMPEAHYSIDPDQPGPFAFVDRDKVLRVLRQAGFEDVAVDRFDADVLLADSDVEAAVDFVITAGPVSRLLVDASAELREHARSVLRTLLAPSRSERGFTLAGSSWIVTARS